MTLSPASAPAQPTPPETADWTVTDARTSWLYRWANEDRAHGMLTPAECEAQGYERFRPSLRYERTWMMRKQESAHPIALSDAERYVVSRARNGEALSWMHRRVLWRLAGRGVSLCLP